MVICKRNQPVAELRPVATKRTEPRLIGLGLGLVEIPDSFFEPLPAEDLDGFTGGPLYPPPRSSARNVADRLPAPFAGRPAPRRRGHR